MDTVLKRKKPEFDYSFGMTLQDVLIHEKGLGSVLDNLNIIHGGFNGCHKKIKIKRNKTELTFRCDCGTLIIYPQRKDRDGNYMAIFISKRDFDARRKNNK